MKIGEASTLRTAQNLRRRTSAGNAAAGDFSAYLDAAQTSGADAAGAPAATAPVGNLESLLAAQEMPEETLRRQTLIRQGHDMIESLESLRQSLLTGRIPPAVLSELSGRLAVQRQSVTDPKLIGIIEDIELRVAVELAKLEEARRWREQA